MAKAVATSGDCAKEVSSSFRSLGVNNKDDGCKRRRGKKKALQLQLQLQLHHLPPDILGDILSRLSFKEAARMSILSSRWRRLWRSCNRNLVFTRKTMFSHTSMSRKRADFIRNVNGVLCQLKSTTPRNKFVLKFKLRKLHARRSVNRWVTFCSASRAKHIVFDFNPGSWGGDRANWCNFSLHHFNGSPNSSHVRSLRLMSAFLDLPPDFCGFTNLKKLNLDSVSIPGGNIQCLLLPACSVLEWLRIVRCNLHILTTSQPLCQLRYLCVENCKEMHKVELQAPNLAMFKFDTCYQPVPIVLDGCVKIEEVTVTLSRVTDLFDYAFADLPGGFLHVRKFSVDFAIDSEVHGFAKCPSSFVNLRHLILTIYVVLNPECTSGILRLACLLELAPVLEQLELHMEFHNGEGEIIMQLEELPPPHRPHDHLKMVHMTGVHGYSNLLNLALHFARNATALERMVIDPMVKNSFYRIRRAEEASAWGRLMAKEYLKGQGLDDILTIL